MVLSSCQNGRSRRRRPAVFGRVPRRLPYRGSGRAQATIARLRGQRPLRPEAVACDPAPLAGALVPVLCQLTFTRLTDRPMPLPSDWLSWLWANREEIVRLLTLIGGAIGIYFLAIRTRAADRTARAALDQAKTAADQAKTAADRHEAQTKADQERRITESFAKAVEQLGSDKLETRLGAIYTLERISQESEREYWPIMETLTAYVREHAPWPPRQAHGANTSGREGLSKARPPNS